MSVIWTLKHFPTGVTQTLAQWGIEGVQITRRSFDVETMGFMLKVADVLAEPAFAYEDEVALYRDGVCWFRGNVTSFPGTGTGQSEFQQYLVSNAWWKLARIIYQQQYVHFISGVMAAGYSTKVVLCQDPWGNKISASGQIIAALNYAVHLNELQASQVVAGNFDPIITPPMETVRDISVAEVIRRMIGYAPDCIGWWDYTDDPPTFHVKRRANLDAVSLDLNDKNLVEEVNGITPLYDLKVPGVLITFITQDSEGRVVETRQEASDGGPLRAGWICASIELALQATDIPEAVTSGFATAIYNALSVLNWRGTVRLHQQDVSGAVKVRNVLNLLNGRAAWAMMAATVQGVDEDLDNGWTTVTFGAPEQLGISDFIGAMMRMRQRPPGGGFPETQNNGSEGVPEDSGGVGGDPDVPPEDRTGNDKGGSTPCGQPGGGTSHTINGCDESGNPTSITVWGS